MKKITYLLAMMMLISGVAFASFPIKNVPTAENQITTQIDNNDQIGPVAVESVTSVLNETDKDATAVDEDFIILLLLWFFLGGVAAHRWYAGKPVGANILYILTAGGCGIWAIIDLIKIIKGEFMV